MDGVLVLAKPAGPTSHDMVALVRRLSATRRVGHGGTLDPFASGVLPLFLGSATRLVEYHMADRKAYRATVCFGATSTTDDLEGELTPVDAPAPSRASVEAALASFRGAISQLPPDYSAIKVSGRRAYALARAGQKPQLTTRDVTIDRLELTDWDESDTLRPLAILEIECSAGTYVRSIARDLGAALGTGAYLGALVRTASGPFRLENAVSLEEVRAAAAEGPARLAALLQPPDAGLHAFPRLELELNEIAAIARGQFVKPGRPVPPLPDDTTHLRLVDGAGRLVAIGTARGGRLVPEKVFLPGSDIPPLVDAGRGSARIDPELEAAIAAERDPSADEDPDRLRQMTSSPGAMSDRDVTHAAKDTGVEVVPGLAALTAEHGPLFVVVGVFDGIHRGHLYLLRELQRVAAAHDARPAVITFDAHPDEVLTGKAPPLLCDPDERLARLAAAGVEVTVVQHFDQALRVTPYDGFVGMITSRTKLAGLLMTPDAAFGYERRGTPDALSELGGREGFEVVVVPTFELDGEPVRSADIRAAVAAGDLAGARLLLGRPLAVVGNVTGRHPSSEAGNELVELGFSMPVSLPPPGRYEAKVGLPLTVGEPKAEASVEALCTVSNTAPAVRVECQGELPSASRLRVLFSD